MESYATVTTTDTAIIETGTFIHDGNEFTSGGAYVTSELVTAYVKPETMLCDAGIITLWDGTRIGTYQTVTTWKQYGNQLGRYTMRSIRAQINYGPAKGVYHGRFNDDWSSCVNLRKYN